MATDPSGEPWALARTIVDTLPAPDDVYVLDICEADGELALIELNPFGGADLYACDTDAVAVAIERIASV